MLRCILREVIIRITENKTYYYYDYYYYYCPVNLIRRKSLNFEKTRMCVNHLYSRKSIEPSESLNLFNQIIIKWQQVNVLPQIERKNSITTKAARVDQHKERDK